MANAELLQKTLEYIKANPEAWDQYSWTHCFAGKALKLSGVEPMDFEGSIKIQAAELLGLELPQGTCGCGVRHGESHELFDMHNTLDDLERIVRDLIAEELLSA